MFAFAQYATFRARRYRVTRTIWRGVRFWMTGSGWAYAGRSLLWGVLALVTLGFAYPWREAALERYKMGHTNFGSMPGGFVGSGWSLFKGIWRIWLAGLVPIALLGGAGVAWLLNSPAMTSFGYQFGDSGKGIMTLATVLGCIGLLVLPFLHAARVGKQWRWWVHGLRMGRAEFTNNVDFGEFVGVYWTVIGLFVLIYAGLVAAGFLIGWGMQAWLGGPGALKAFQSPWAIVPMALAYVGVAQLFGVILRIYTQQRIWKIIVDTSGLCNQEHLATAAAAGIPAGALGEGLADGLHVAGF